MNRGEQTNRAKRGREEVERGNENHKLRRHEDIHMYPTTADEFDEYLDALIRSANLNVCLTAVEEESEKKMMIEEIENSGGRILL